MDRYAPIAATVLLLATGLATPPAGGAGAWTESYESWNYRDGAHTTALWDTSAGELALPPLDPALGLTLDSPGFSFHIALEGTLACLADGDFGLLTFDRADPESTVFLGAATTPGLAQAVAISGKRAFVADSYAGLMVFDIAIPAAPVPGGSIPTPVRSRGVKISGSIAWVTYSDGPVSGLQAFDISGPAPIARGSVTVPGHAYGLDLAGDFAFIAAADGGLQIMNITDPDAPAFAASAGTFGFSYDVEVRNGLAWVADHSGGLVVFDVSDPEHPVPAGGHETTGPAFGIALEGDRVYLAVGQSGLDVIGLDASGGLHSLGALDPGDRLARGLAVENGHVYLANGEDGLHVISTPDPWYDTGANLAQSLPLPTGGGTIASIRLTASRLGTVDWEISADGGAHWEAVSAEGSWTAMSWPGDQLIWRSELSLDGSGHSPRIQELTLEWDDDDPTAVRPLSLDAGSPPLTLHAGRPNPFTDHVRIDYELPRRSRVTLDVLDATGRRVCSLTGHGPGVELGAGPHRAVWSGRDERGRPVSTGVYFVRLGANEVSEVRKVLYVR